MTVDALVQDKHVNLNGLRFHYREWGSETIEPIVLLHGWTDNCRVWDTVSAALADHYHLFALDQRGHGESEWAKSWEEYALDNKVADLDAFISVLGLSQVTLVGHSGGGAHPTYLYTPQSNKVKRLIIVDAGPGPRDGADSIPSPLPETDDARSFWYTAGDFENPEAVYPEIRRMWTLRHMSDEECRHRFDSKIKQLNNSSKWTLRYDSKLRSQTGLTVPPSDEATHWQALSRISCPTLLIRGDESHLVSRAKAQRVAQTIPNCRVVEVHSSTHYPHLDNPEQFVDIVRTFLADL